MTGLTYTDRFGKKHDISAENAKDAIAKLSHIPGYINNDADALTAGLEQGLKQRRKQRAADFAASGQTWHGDQFATGRAGVGTTVTLTCSGGLIYEDGAVVGEKQFDVNVENGMVVGTSGMREIRYEKADYQKKWQEWFTDYWDGWFGRWWSSNWRSYAHWL